MPQHVTVKISPDGKKEVDVIGGKGPSCITLIHPLVQGRKVLEQSDKPEIYDGDASGGQLESVGG